MATHVQNIEKLRTAIYGEEVRTAMIELFEEDYSLVKDGIGIGNDISSESDPITGYPDGSVYINNETYDVFKLEETSWVKKGNIKGANGVGISSIEKTSTSGLVDTYTITYDNGITTTFTVTNGTDGTDGEDGTSLTATSSKVGKVTTVEIKNAETGQILTTLTINDGADGGGSGDMTKAVYDTNGDGIVDSAETLNGLTASVTELNYMDGATGNIQDQLNDKIEEPESEGTSGQALMTDGNGNRYWGNAGAAKTVESSQFNVNAQGNLSLSTQVTSKLVNEVNPTLAGTEDAVEGLDIGGTKYKVGGGHTLDTEVSTVEETTSENQHVPSSYTLKKYANSFKYKFVVEFEAEGNSLGTPIEDKTTWSSATETAAGWIFADDTQAVRDLFIGLDANDSANLDWRFDPVSQDKGIAIARWQFDTATGMMCFVFNRKCSVGTKFSIDLEFLREFDDLI